jgi:hypothetical protein
MEFSLVQFLVLVKRCIGIFSIYEHQFFVVDVSAEPLTFLEQAFSVMKVKVGKETD